MIVNRKVKITTDPRGRITSGKRDEKGIPQKLGYFNLAAFPELFSAYGLEPLALVVFFPTDRIEDFFDDNFVRWGTGKGKAKGTKIRQCNGESCIHRIDEDIDDKRYAAGEETECICQNLPENDKRRCKYECYFKAFIALPQTGKIESPLCYMFSTHSENSGAAVRSELEKMKVINRGVLRGIPFMLSVRMASSLKAADQTFPVWTLTTIGTLSQIKQLSAYEVDPLLLGPASIVREVNPKKRLLDQLIFVSGRIELKAIYNEAKEKLKGEDFLEVEAEIKKKAKLFPKDSE